MDLLIGFGNPTRQDDGAGWDVLQRLEALNLPSVETRLAQQLGLEILEDWGVFERVLFIDAGQGPGETRLEKIAASEIPASASTHHLKPETLLQLSQKLYGITPDLYLCRIPGVRFDFGEGLSPSAQGNVDLAVRLIKEWLKQST